jgi:hypothetical protein
MGDAFWVDFCTFFATVGSRWEREVLRLAFEEGIEIVSLWIRLLPGASPLKLFDFEPIFERFEKEIKFYNYK